MAQNTPSSRQQAGQVLSEMYDYFTSIHYIAIVIEVLALQALLDQAEGREKAALAALQQALELAEPGGVIRTFIDLGAPLQRLLVVLVREAAASPYAARILAAFPQAHSPEETRHQANAALLSPLTARELEVLALLARRYTDKEIAETLVISPDTVHSHVQHIGDKLGASGRRAMVQAAIDLDLLEQTPFPSPENGDA